jgi:hypothetical protein
MLILVHIHQAPRWPLNRPYTPLATSAQAALAPHQTADKGGICCYNFHGNVTYQSVYIVLLN